MVPTDPQAIGLAGVAQGVRIRRHFQYLRKGKVFKETDHTTFAITSWLPDEAAPERLLEVARGRWSIENGQFHRRDRTQREDWCICGNPRAAQNLALFRSLAIFLFEQQALGKRGRRSLPDFQHHVHRHPWGLIRRLTQARHEA